MKVNLEEDWSSAVGFPLNGLIQDSDFAYLWASFTLCSPCRAFTYIEHIVSGGSQLPPPQTSRWLCVVRLEGRKALGPEAGECNQEWIRNKWKGRLQQPVEVRSSKRWGWHCQKRKERVILALYTLRKSSLGEQNVLQVHRLRIPGRSWEFHEVGDKERKGEESHRRKNLAYFAVSPKTVSELLILL